MPAYFLDTSALVKLYIDEIGSNWALNLFAANNDEIFVAAIAEVELISAITRRSRGASISPTNIQATCTQIRNDFQTEYQVIAINETIIASATTFAETYGLRGYDAVQLAVGQAVNQIRLLTNLKPVSFVSADNELNAAASQEGFRVENPNNFP